LRGVYEYPAFSRLLNAPANQDADAIAQAIARARGWTLISFGEIVFRPQLISGYYMHMCQKLFSGWLKSDNRPNPALPK